ncbi:MAG: BamA/TamA family outer membrane protein [Bacteroidales bacterium]|nr:BamA/TamA family outer membrane protein [Bacteroidales bacterium]
MRPGLSIHNSIKEPQKEKGVKYWLKYKLGQPPVLFDEEICSKLNLTFENRLYHKGFFNSNSTFKIHEKKKTFQIEYFIQTNKVYKIDTVIFPEPIDQITQAINQSRTETFITKGMPYSLETLKEERKRIDQELKNLGYYYFTPDYLIFKADSMQGNHRVELKLLLKNDNPKESAEVFKINRVYVAEDFRLKNYLPDTSSYGNYTMISAENYMRPEVLLNSVFLQNDSLYSKTDHNNTLRQLMGIGAYKYVNARYTESPDKKDALDALLILTPSQKMSVSTELNAVSKSNNFAGPGMKLSFKSRNFLRGAEVFSINLNGRFEKQITGENEGDLAYEVSVDANLDIPRNFPFKIKKVSRPYVPFTSISTGTGIYSRQSLYKFQTYNTGLEYTWRKNRFLTQLFKPINISLTNLIDASEEFKQFLSQNPSLGKSFEEQFIIGTSYNFIYNHLNDPKKAQYYFSFGADPSGNMVGLIHKLTSGEKNSPEDPAKLFGLSVSQYLRFRIDSRYYIKTGEEATIATRLYGGVGLPYGNSTVIPYVKQFYAGGTNSIRAFRARSLGPGSYQPPDSLKNILIDQTGEIKMEANVEYRFPIIGYLKGALFTDVGNIWLVREDSLRHGGKFDLNTFYKELAVGVGVGLRIDVNLLVLRFDWAFPVRKPWLPENQRWVFHEINPFETHWRKENLVWNISIGYPF